MGATPRARSESETSGYQDREWDLVSATLEAENCWESPGEREPRPARSLSHAGLLQLQEWGVKQAVRGMVWIRP